MQPFKLNLCGTPCPINYVRTKLKLDSMNSGDLLEVMLDDGEAIESVSKSIIEEGHSIQSKIQNQDSTWNLIIVCK